MRTVTGRQSWVKPFTWTIVALGASVCVVSAYNLPLRQLNAGALLLSALTAFFGSRLTIQLPRAKVHISVSDTLVFLILILFGGELAVLVAATEALLTSLRLKRNGITIRADCVLFNTALLACSTFLTVAALRFYLGPTATLFTTTSYSTLITALCVMALVQYASNSSLAAFYTASESKAAIWDTWYNYYFPTSFTYFAGAIIAGGLIKINSVIGIYQLLTIASAITLIYFTFRRYINDLKASLSQAEQAEHARAEIEKARAEQGERHIEELNHYVDELERATNELQASKEHFRHAAFHDALTDLPNRAFFTDYLKVAIARAKLQPDYQFAVLFLDLDRFKNINDSLGHTYGDQLIVAIADRLKRCLRQVDIVARLGGDEFAILLDGLHEPSDAIHCAEKIQKEISRPLTIEKSEAFTSASIGIALSTAGYERPEDVLRDADTAMYRAKESGKARHEVFDKLMYARAVSILNLENDLRRAIERQQFRLYYQPIVVLKTGEICGFEALVRWQHPEQGLISPAEFIPAAEETGLIVPLGQWVLEEACRQTREWQRQFSANPRLIVSVNLSGKQLSQGDLFERIQQILKTTELDPRCLKLEITESVVMDNPELAITILNKLHEFGIELSIDDFGTGYSSLSYLHRFPVNDLKIDRSFISGMGLGDENLEIVRTITVLARNLGMKVIAEGIETKEQLAQLRALSCELGQGYLFSEPVDAESLASFIQKDQQNSLLNSIEFSQKDNSKYLDSSLVM